MAIFQNYIFVLYRLIKDKYGVLSAVTKIFQIIEYQLKECYKVPINKNSSSIIIITHSSRDSDIKKR